MAVSPGTGVEPSTGPSVPMPQGDAERRYPDALRSVARRVRQAAGGRESTYRALVRLLEPRFRSRQLVGDDTLLVVEGFGGSGNTFVTAALDVIGFDAERIAHHHHAPCQVVAGVRRRIPTIVMVRHPDAAVCSLVRRDFVTSAAAGFAAYTTFYERLDDVAQHVYAVPFDQLIADPDEVVRRIAGLAGHIQPGHPPLDDQRAVLRATGHPRLGRVVPVVMTDDEARRTVSEVADDARRRAADARERFLARAGRLC